jgi:hypothetical protein
LSHYTGSLKDLFVPEKNHWVWFYFRIFALAFPPPGILPPEVSVADFFTFFSTVLKEIHLSDIYPEDIFQIVVFPFVCWLLVTLICSVLIIHSTCCLFVICLPPLNSVFLEGWNISVLLLFYP